MVAIRPSPGPRRGARRGPLCLDRGGQRRAEWGNQRTLLGHDRRDELGRGHVEGGFQTIAPGGATRTPANSRTSVGVRSSIGIAGPFSVSRSTELDRGADVERHAVAGSQRGQRVRPDLVRRVAVRGDPIRSDQDGVDRTRGEERAGRRVGDERVRHPCLLELPGGQPGALEIRPGLVDVDVDLPARLNGGLDDTQRRPELAAGQRTGVAVGQDLERPIDRGGQRGPARARRAGRGPVSPR